MTGCGAAGHERLNPYGGRLRRDRRLHARPAWWRWVDPSDAAAPRRRRRQAAAHCRWNGGACGFGQRLRELCHPRDKGERKSTSLNSSTKGQPVCGRLLEKKKTKKTEQNR